MRFKHFRTVELDFNLLCMIYMILLSLLSENDSPRIIREPESRSLLSLRTTMCHFGLAKPVGFYASRNRDYPGPGHGQQFDSCSTTWYWQANEWLIEKYTTRKKNFE